MIMPEIHFMPSYQQSAISFTENKLIGLGQKH
jgi:hypothetical protein